MKIDIPLSYQHYLKAKFAEWLSRGENGCTKRKMEVEFMNTPDWYNTWGIKMKDITSALGFDWKDLDGRVGKVVVHEDYTENMLLVLFIMEDGTSWLLHQGDLK